MVEKEKDFLNGMKQATFLDIDNSVFSSQNLRIGSSKELIATVHYNLYRVRIVFCNTPSKSTQAALLVGVNFLYRIYAFDLFLF